MKKLITTRFNYLALAIICLLNVTTAFAGDPTVEKRKTYMKTYPLSANQKVSVKNSFGEVIVKDYSGSEIKVEVTVIATSTTDAKAQNILDDISIVDKSGSTVSFETKINGRGNGVSRGGKNQHMEVNYIVYMPENNPLSVQNEFGKTTLGNRSGLTAIVQKFGELEVGNLSNVDEITVEFGSINAQKLSGGKTIFKYSEVKIGNMSNLVKSTLEFCAKTKFGIGADVTDININNSYSDIELNFPTTFNATFDIHTSFGDFDNDTAFKITDVDEDEEDRGPKFDKDFRGVSGTGSVKVKIRSSFGKIRFN